MGGKKKENEDLFSKCCCIQPVVSQSVAAARLTLVPAFLFLQTAGRNDLLRGSRLTGSGNLENGLTRLWMESEVLLQLPWKVAFMDQPSNRLIGYFCLDEAAFIHNKQTVELHDVTVKIRGQD